MHQESAEVLKRLCKGKFAFSEDQLITLWRDLAQATEHEVRAVVAKPVKKPKEKAEKPQWLIDVEGSRKLLKWTAAEATRKLVEVAVDEGFIAADFFEGRKIPAFGAAAKQISKLSGGERLASAFRREVVRLGKEYRLG